MPGPNRPDALASLSRFLNGCPVYLGQLVSTGPAVNNHTTSTPFANIPRGVAPQPVNLLDTLAGKMLLLQPTADGVILPAASNAVTVTLQTGAVPGVLVGLGERVILLMRPDYGWLQWMPSAGAANLLVWELT